MIESLLCFNNLTFRWHSYELLFFTYELFAILHVHSTIEDLSVTKSGWIFSLIKSVKLAWIIVFFEIFRNETIIFRWVSISWWLNFNCRECFWLIFLDQYFSVIELVQMQKWLFIDVWCYADDICYGCWKIDETFSALFAWYSKLL